MVSLTIVQESNLRIPSALPPGLVAVFVGGTSGIGESTLRQFAKYARQPRIYLVGRSQEAGDRISSECKKDNPEGEFIFIKADTSLMKRVDEVCRDILSRETQINLLFLSQGTLNFRQETSEGLNYAVALTHYGRSRFILNLLPLLQKAKGLRRVVTVCMGTKEGPLNFNDIQRRNVPVFQGRGHMSSLVTLSLEVMAQKAPDVSFVHDYPSSVKSGIGRDLSGPMKIIMSAIYAVFGFLLYVPFQESGERHLYLATSARFRPQGAGVDTASGIPLAENDAVAKGTDGQSGSGVYSVNWDCESAGESTTSVLAKLREDKALSRILADMEAEYTRITGNLVV